ncbi:type III restriction endonuclease StyLTI [Campylobacterota bacterium]|nr:type III restriction endonuclease StyLTI [Campylobacterota bacterium]
MSKNRIKLIYIDPPYNTGKEFVYSDHFEFNDEKLRSVLGYNDKEIARLKSIQGRSSHSAWLTFMYPRLKIAQKLLTNDGVIFVSIDDNEQANLKLLMDDLFGEGNFVTTFIWEKTQHFGRQKLNYYSNADYILCYAKQLSENGELKQLLIERTLDEFEDAPLYNASNNVKELTFPVGTVKFNIEDGVYKETTSSDYILKNEVIVKDGKNSNAFVLQFKSRWANDTVQEEIQKGTSFWVKTTNFAIRAIYGEGKIGALAPKQILFTNQKNEFCARNKFNVKVDTSETATNSVNALLGDKMFSYPKPSSLIAYLISLCANNQDDLILDFFAGSATTAHAVMQLNAEDGGSRKYMMVQLDEPTNLDSQARKAGYNTIDEISCERIKRAAQKTEDEMRDRLLNDGDFGFKRYRLVTPCIQTLEKIIEFDPNDSSLFNGDMIASFAHPETNTSGLETLLATWLIDDGYSFDTVVEEKMFAGYIAHYICESATLYLINQGWDTDALKVLLNQIGKNELLVNTLIVYSYSFAFEAMLELKTNIKTTLDNAPSIVERY